MSNITCGLHYGSNSVCATPNGYIAPVHITRSAEPSPLHWPGTHINKDSSDILSPVSENTFTADELLFIEGCLEQANEALAWAELCLPSASDAVPSTH